MLFSSQPASFYFDKQALVAVRELVGFYFDSNAFDYLFVG